MRKLRRVWLFVRASVGIAAAVCELARVSAWDFHSHHDTADGIPDHFVPLKCVRCGREFWL